MEPLKNILSPQLVVCIGEHLKKHLPCFNPELFQTSILKDLESLELKTRAQLISDHLHEILPDNLKVRNRILKSMLHPNTDNTVESQSDNQSNKMGIRGWGILPLTMVVGQHGVEEFEDSLSLLKEMTTRFTSEFGVRYFLLADQNRALKIMSGWVNDPDFHVRRLVSEGTRPRLPWAMQLPDLIADPTPVLPLLQVLRDDDELYVGRSVANHLNDASKDHPELVTNLSREWMENADEKRKRVIRHACRTLIKQGDPKTLSVFGYDKPQVELKELKIQTEKIELGQSLKFCVDLRSISATSQPLIIDYILHFVKANGDRKGKVFKWKTTTIQPGEGLILERRHAIRSITTRKYYSGSQALSLRINGQDFGFVEFELSSC